MNIPSNLKYSKDHEWIRVEGDEAYVGITDFAQSQLGDIVFVDVTTEGKLLPRVKFSVRSRLLKPFQMHSCLLEVKCLNSTLL